MKALLLATTDPGLITQVAQVRAEVVRVDSLEGVLATRAQLGETVALAYGQDIAKGYRRPGPLPYPAIVLCTDANKLDWHGAICLGADYVVELPPGLHWLHERWLTQPAVT